MLLLIALKRYCLLWWLCLTPQRGARFTLRRFVLMLVLLPLFGLVQILNGLGLLLDELLFRRYRRIEIREPVFILGLPRSGTTHLHQVLAKDDRFTSLALWECLFAPSISARYFWRAVGRLDRSVGSPLARLLKFVQRRLFGALDETHPVALAAPEEDYLTLLPILACFVLVVPVPSATWLWRMGHFETDLSEAEQSRLLDFYGNCLRRHLYVHGPDKRLLSKNAAFASLAISLAQRFPDARFVVCTRDTASALASQLSTLDPAVRLFDGDGHEFARRFISLFRHYRAQLDAFMRGPSRERTMRIAIEQQSTTLLDTVGSLYNWLSLPMTDDYRVMLERSDEQSRAYRSPHKVTLDRFGVTPESLRAIFGET